MRHIHIDQVDHIDRPVVAIGNIYPDGHSIVPHHHRRGQLMSAISGLIVLTTPTGELTANEALLRWPFLMAHSI